MANALTLGLFAALAWGVHDVCVRFISQRTSILPTLLTVLIAGGVITLPLALAFGNWSAMNQVAYGLSGGAGLAFAVASFGLYKAFAIGPVRLVAPLIAAYPILSVGWASLSGSQVMLDDWLAIIAIIVGIGIVANNIGLVDGDPAPLRGRVVIWSIISGCGFAMTFAMSQAAALVGAELPVIIVTRTVAIAGIAASLIAYHGISKPNLRLSRHFLLLIMMGALDALALAAVTISGRLPNPEYAAVTSSIFGMVTIILARLFLHEKMTPSQWGGVIIVFAAIAYLGA